MIRRKPRDDDRAPLLAEVERRERIATAAMQGILTNPAAGVCWPMQEIARYAVSYADALIAELDKEPQP